MLISLLLQSTAGGGGERLRFSRFPTVCAGGLTGARPFPIPFATSSMLKSEREVN